MNFELNEEGRNTYPTRRDYIKALRDLCFSNNIDKTYTEKNGEVEIMLADANDKGIYLSNNYRNPFILDYDNKLDFSQDYPSIEEAFYRMWNLNNLIKFGMPFKRESVMNADVIERDRSLISFERNGLVIEQKMRAMAFKDDKPLSSKAALVLCYSAIRIASQGDEEIEAQLKEYAQELYCKGDYKDNLGRLKDWTAEIVDASSIGKLPIR